MGKVQSLTDAQYKKIGGDHVMWDTKTNKAVAVNRDQIGKYLEATGIDPALEGTYKVKLVDGSEVPVMPVFQMYKVHLQDFDLDSTHEICGAQSICLNGSRMILQPLNRYPSIMVRVSTTGSTQPCIT